MSAATTPTLPGWKRWLGDTRVLRRTALTLWVLPMLVIAILVAYNPSKRTVTHLYHEASANWWSGKDLYQGPGGMNYLPHFAVLFSPFHALPLRAGEILWRATEAVLLAGGIWNLARRQFGESTMCPFVVARIVALPLALPA